jgi:hypothetical protein
MEDTKKAEVETRIQKMIAALEAPLDRSVVKKHPTTGFDYVEGYYVINKANEIFGFDGWSMEADYENMKEYDMGTTHSGSKKGMVFIPVKITLETDGTNYISRTGAGTCIWYGDDQRETGIKGAETDGMKRAFRSFGNQFGNSLYGGDTEPTVVRTAGTTSYQTATAQESTSDSSTVFCDAPGCTGIMRKRNGKNGEFYGCSNYPSCKNTANVNEVSDDGKILRAEKPSRGFQKSYQKDPVNFQIPEELIPDEIKAMREKTRTSQDNPDKISISDVPF